MRNRRLTVALVVALATVGTVGALAVLQADEAGDERTLSGVSKSGTRTSDASATAGSAGSPGSTGVTTTGVPAAGEDRTGDAGEAPGVSGSAEVASSYLPVAGLGSSQTYEASVEIIGWRDSQARLAEVRIVSAELLGPMDPATGQPSGESADPKLDRSGYVEGRRLLVTVTAHAAEGLPASGVTDVYLVFVPSGEGAVFWIDRVVQ